MIPVPENTSRCQGGGRVTEGLLLRLKETRVATDGEGRGHTGPFLLLSICYLQVLLIAIYLDTLILTHSANKNHGNQKSTKYHCTMTILQQADGTSLVNEI